MRLTDLDGLIAFLKVAERRSFTAAARDLGVTILRDAGYEVGITAGDADMLPSYDFVLEDDSVIEVGRVRLRTIATPVASS